MTITPEQLAKQGSEDAHQMALMCWCNQNLDKYPQLKWLTHIPNGGWRSKSEATRFKAMGVKKGFPDLFLPVPHLHYYGLFIELKIPELVNAKNGGASEHQLEWQVYLQNANYQCVLCYGWYAATIVLMEYLEGCD